jgi:hypothetical protein
MEATGRAVADQIDGPVTTVATGLEGHLGGGRATVLTD